MYRVVFQFYNDYGYVVDDYIDNNGNGFTKDEADYLALQIAHSSIRNFFCIEVQKM